MKKVIAVLAAVTMAGVASADIYANLSVGYGVSGNGGAGGVVNAVDGTELFLQVLSGGGDGLQGNALYNNLSGMFMSTGNDTVLASWSAVVTAGGADFSDFAATLRGDISTANTPDTFIRISGITEGDWVYQSAIAFADLDSTDPLVLPEAIFVDNGGTGSTATADTVVNVIPEPATIGLMGIAGLGMFLARRKARR